MKSAHSTLTPTVYWACNHPSTLLTSIQIRSQSSQNSDSLVLWRVKGLESWDVRRVNIYVEAHCLWLQLPGPALLSERCLQWLALCGPCARSPATTERTLDPETDGFSSPLPFLLFYPHLLFRVKAEGETGCLCAQSVSEVYRWNPPETILSTVCLNSIQKGVLRRYISWIFS